MVTVRSGRVRWTIDAFVETQHPRGQPENAGEFARVPGAKQAPKRAAKPAAPGGPHTAAVASIAARAARTHPSTRMNRGVDELVADASSMSSWRDWYDRHTATIRDIFGDDAALFQKLLSVTSQAATVKSNVALALKALQQYKTGSPFVGYLPGVIRNLDRIRAETAVSGQKISSYTAANEGQAEQFVVDRHISQLFFGTDKPSTAQVAKAKAAGAVIARKMGWTPRQVQAALWAYNQVRNGTKVEDVQSYDGVLKTKSEQIRTLLAGFRQPDAGGAGGGVRAGPAAAQDRAIRNLARRFGVAAPARRSATG